VKTTQVLGVNNAVASVERQEELKKQFPPEKRLAHRVALLEAKAPQGGEAQGDLVAADMPKFWHTQGSGKSYSMAFFAEKVRRAVLGNFTFVITTDREDLDDQIWRTFIGCGITDEKTPAARGESPVHL
jgi:type I restriction enzyme, R subunit